MEAALETEHDHFGRISNLVAAGERAEALATARDLVHRFPRHRRGWWQLGQLLVDAGDDVAAWRAFKTGYRLDPDGMAPVGLLAVLATRGRLRSAAMLAARLDSRRGRLARLDGMLAKVALARRDTNLAAHILEGARRAGLTSGLLQRSARSLGVMQRELADDSMCGLRHIAIGGVSHVGSTVLGIILGSIPGFAFAGETHSLTEVKLRHTGGRGRVPVSRDIPSRQWPVPCRVCRRNCEVFDEAYRLALAADEKCPYGNIARRLGTSNLVTSDKSPMFYLQNDPLCRFDLIVSFKSPVQQMRSELKNMWRLNVRNQQDIEKSIEKKLNEWSRNYLEQIYHLDCSGRKIYLQWERFVREPEFHIARLGAALDIPLTASVLTNIRLGHFTGGNSGVDVDDIRRSRTIALRPSNAPDLPPELEAVVRSHKRAAYVHGLLERRCEAVFGKRDEPAHPATPAV